jgi:hypothetical protein
MMLAGVTSSNSGSYELVFIAGGLSVTSSVVSLKVNPPATINMQQTGDNLIMSWPLGVLVQATNVAGPWTTNNSSTRNEARAERNWRTRRAADFLPLAPLFVHGDSVAFWGASGQIIGLLMRFYWNFETRQD